MRRFPASTWLPAVLAGIVAACERGSEGPAAEVPVLPFSAAPLPADSFGMVSGTGDTLSFRTIQAEAGTRVARYRRGARGVDSLVAVIESDTKVPIYSLQHRHLESGPVTAEVLYGRGFDGQARLVMTTEAGRGEANLRTPPPTLDMAQLPLTLGALQLGETDSLSFNYVAPFERRSLAARLLVTPDTLAIDGGQVAAWRLRLLVSGLEERYWLEAEPPHRLLRIEEVTRNATWERL